MHDAAAETAADVVTCRAGGCPLPSVAAGLDDGAADSAATAGAVVGVAETLPWQSAG